MSGLCDQDQIKRTIEFYSQQLSRYGIDPRSLDWGSRATQQLRFAVLCQVSDLHNTSVLDVGCGLADLLEYLEHHEISTLYTGIDVTPSMIAMSQERFPSAQFELCDVSADAYQRTIGSDFVLASGLFTFGDYAFFKKAVLHMFSMCRVALAFNVLSTAAPLQESGEFHADPGETLRFCQSLTPWTVLRHDYLPNDFTVYMYHERPQR